MIESGGAPRGRKLAVRDGGHCATRRDWVRSMTLPLVYKDEQDIVDLARELDDSDVCFFPEETELAHRFLASLRSESIAKRERPDFEDLTSSLLVEAMIVDDHPRPGNKDKSRINEREVVREVAALGLDLHPGSKIITTVSSGLSTEHDHNYEAYLRQFTTTVLKHAGKSNAYRSERPNFELGFLILDESTAYFESSGSFGRTQRGRPHWWFADAKFAKVVLRSEADCIVWLTPYKLLQDETIGRIPLPQMTIIDVARLRDEELMSYDVRRMVSSEV